MTIEHCLTKCRDGVAAGGASACGYVQRQVAMPKGVWFGVEEYANQVGRGVGDVLADIVAYALADAALTDDREDFHQLAEMMMCGDLDCPVDDEEDGLPARGSTDEA